jgi:CHAT domain-containing protein
MGSFMSLPIHAAGDATTSCSKYVVSSYAPTLSALLRAQTQIKSVARKNARVLLVAEDSSSDATLPTLSGVAHELGIIRDAVDKALDVQVVDYMLGSATVDRVAQGLISANFVHLASHGIQNERDALESSFCLKDGRLTVSKLMELRLDGAFMAFLSACETAKGDHNLPDQTVHLAAAMLFAGFKSVIATMWFVHYSFPVHHFHYSSLQ